MLLEYAPPLVTNRPDFVIVSPGTVVVGEAKTGSSNPGAAARKQALGYAEDLFWFHPGARSRRIVPLVWSAGAGAAVPMSPGPERLPRPDEVPRKDDVLVVDSDGVRRLLHAVEADEGSPQRLVDVSQWRSADYQPRPSIVDAAVALVASTEDSGVTAALSDDDELSRLTSLLVDEVHEAASKKQHRVLLVSGVPGAGKTLVGLRLAHDPTVVERLRDLGSVPLYLSGNGPLVSVLTEALARDFNRRSGMKMKEARRRAGVLVKLVHSFTRDALRDSDPLDVPHVAIFDEGQRVWDEDQMRRKHDLADGREVSEPEVILQRLEKRDWAVVVALIGEGQEINTGETGAELWLQAVADRAGASDVHWSAKAPPALARSAHGEISAAEELLLKRTRRSVGAAWLAAWVAAVLADDPSRARRLAQRAVEDEKPYQLRFTRSLSTARRWLRDEARHARSGLVASARAARLRPYGLEMSAGLQGEIGWPAWFLDRPPSLASSSALEVAASEFKCQGLELDYIGLAWSWDLVREHGTWVVRRLHTGTWRWRGVNAERERFGINAYRVLMTRARSGMVIWVPEGSAEDPTRDPGEMDRVADYLLDCGLEALEE